MYIMSLAIRVSYILIFLSKHIFISSIAWRFFSSKPNAPFMEMLSAKNLFSLVIMNMMIASLLPFVQKLIAPCTKPKLLVMYLRSLAHIVKDATKDFKHLSINLKTGFLPETSLAD